jgi:hypothetical protein
MTKEKDNLDKEGLTRRDVLGGWHDPENRECGKLKQG